MHRSHASVHLAAGHLGLQACGTAPCPLDCEGVWGAWGSCSTICGGGNRSRQFIVSFPAQNNGNLCIAADGETSLQACAQNPCPVDCVGEWGPYGNCSMECGGGWSTRSTLQQTAATALRDAIVPAVALYYSLSFVRPALY